MPRCRHERQCLIGTSGFKVRVWCPDCDKELLTVWQREVDPALLRKAFRKLLGDNIFEDEKKNLLLPGIDEDSSSRSEEVSSCHYYRPWSRGGESLSGASSRQWTRGSYEEEETFEQEEVSPRGAIRGLRARREPTPRGLHGEDEVASCEAKVFCCRRRRQ